MWIRSQDRKDLIKTENISVVDCASTFDIETDTKESTFTLGEYSTEEKALKVLDMIQNRILSKDYSTTGIGYPIIKDKVFQMPQDSEV